MVRVLYPNHNPHPIQPWNGNPQKSKSLTSKQKLPVEFTAKMLEARQSSGDCNCLSAGAIAGIVIGCVIGSWLLAWMIRNAFYQPRKDHSYYYTRDERPRRSSSYAYREKPSRGRRYSSIDRPAKVYLSNAS